MMRRYTVNPLALVIVITLSVSGFHGQPSRLTTQCDTIFDEVRRTLPDDNTLARAIKSGYIGDRLERHWMSELRRREIKHVTGTVNFVLRDRKLVLTMERIQFWPTYYYFDREIMLKGSENVDARTTLENSLIPAFFNNATIALAKESSPELCGTLFLNLLDDSCLPLIIEPPMFSKKCN